MTATKRPKATRSKKPAKQPRERCEHADVKHAIRELMTTLGDALTAAEHFRRLPALAEEAPHWPEIHARAKKLALILDEHYDAIGDLAPDGCWC